MSYASISKDGVDRAVDDLFPETPAPAFPASVVTIHAVSPEGFPVSITLNDPAQGAMSKWIALLQDKGFTPTGGKSTPATEKPGQVSDSAQVPPTCPKHNKVMRVSQYGGYFCTAADPDEPNGKCKHKVK